MEIENKKSSKFVSWLKAIGIFLGVIIFLRMFVVPIIFKVFVVPVAMSDVKLKSRDATRVSAVYNIYQMLELYYRDVNSYPEQLIFGGKLEHNGRVYMSKVPKNRMPNDGTCPDDFEFQYNVKDNGQSYELIYCTGSDYQGKKGFRTVRSPSHDSVTE